VAIDLVEGGADRAGQAQRVARRADEDLHRRAGGERIGDVERWSWRQGEFRVTYVAGHADHLDRFFAEAEVPADRVAVRPELAGERPVDDHRRRRLDAIPRREVPAGEQRNAERAE